MKNWQKVIQGTVVCFVAVMCRPAVMASPMAVDSLLPAPGVSFQRAKNISEQEAVLLALRNNPLVFNAELGRVVDKFSLAVAQNAFVPQPAVTASTHYDNHGGFSQELSPGVSLATPLGTKVTLGYDNNLTGGGGSPSVAVTQELLRGAGRYGDADSVALMQEKNQQILDRFAFRDSVIDVVVGVVKAYRALVGDYQQLSFSQRTYLQMKGTVRDDRLRLQAGQIAENTLLQDQSNLALARQDVAAKQLQISQDYQALLATIGLSPQAKLHVNKKINTSDLKIPNKKKILAIALRNNTEYQKALIRVKNDEISLKQARNGMLWDLSVTAKAGGDLSQEGEEGVNDKTVALNLTAPLNMLSQKSALATARINLMEARNSLAQDKFTVERTVQQDIDNLINQKEQIELSEKTVELQERSLKAEEIQKKYGKISAFEYNTMLNQLLQQQQALIQLRVAFLNQAMDLYQYAGMTLNRWNVRLKF